MKKMFVICVAVIAAGLPKMVAGEELVRVAEISGYIYDIESTSDGVWCATSDNVLFLDSADRSVSAYGVNDGLPEADVTAIKAGHDGAVLAVADMTLYEKTGNRWRAVTDVPSGTVLDLERGGDDEMWVATSTGVYRLDGDGCRFWSSEDGLFADKSDCIVAGPGGATWIVHRSVSSGDGFYRNGMSRYDGVSWFVTGEGGRGVGSMGAADLAVSPGGSVLAYSSSRVHVPATGGYKTYETGDFGGGTVETLGFYVDGSVFVASTGAIARFDGVSWDVDGDSVSSRVLSFETTSNSELYACMERGIARFSGNEWINTARTDTIGAGAFTDFSPDANGGLWAGSDAGLYYLITASTESSISRHDSSQSPGDELGR